MLIKKLTDARGLPGDEKEVREIIKEELAGYVDKLTTDRLGNLFAAKNTGAKGKHIALSAHMDEVGLCVKMSDAKGYLKFESWGVDAREKKTKRVFVGKGKVPGVIGAAPIHLLPADQRKDAVTVDKLYIDIGAKDKADAEKYVTPGDFVSFDSEFVEFGDHKIKAKALDDRAGCAAIIEILKSDCPNRITGVFTAQEEIGLRGSSVAANRLDADIVINLEGTISADMEDVDPEREVTVLGKGPALSLIDRRSIYFREYLDEIIECATKNGIPFQYRRTGAGGTDAGSFHTAKTGTPCIGVAVPCRYIHSPVSVMDARDYENAIKLIKEYTR
jgi:endoglucanase